MLQSLQAFYNSVKALGKLGSDLESLMDSIEAVDEQWKQRFINEWAVIEEIYAIALDEQRSVLDKEQLNDVGNAVKELRHMVNNAVRMG